VSGITSISPSSAARRCAPALMLKFSSVQVSPARHHSTGTGRVAACGGVNTAKRIAVPVLADSWR
jgi:hypothetical protein